MGVFAFEEAARHLERAIRIADRREPPDEADRCELLIELGQALWGFDLKRSKEIALEAAKLAEKLGDGERLARAALGIGGVYGYSNDSGTFDDQQTALLERALVALGDDDSVLRARLRARLAVALRHLSGATGDRIAELARDAIKTARHAGDKAAVLQVLAWSTIATWGPEDPSEFIGACREVFGLATELRDAPLERFTRFMTLSRLLEVGDVENANREADLAMELCRSRSDAFGRLSALIISGLQALLAGRFEEAEKINLQMHGVARETQNEIALHAAALQRFLISDELGTLASALTDMRGATLDGESHLWPLAVVTR